MSQLKGFKFPYDQSEQWDGFNEPGIETFAGNPHVHLGREVVQNTLDARLEGTAVPARIIISRIKVPTNTIPDVETLQAAMKACLTAAKHESDKALYFFEGALEILSKPTVNVLRIADYNTTGVRGPCENGTPYFALLKASGQSKKSQATATGSFGIGKYAPFAVSLLRTVFVTTVWKGRDGWHQYVQGKSILMSHHDKTGKTCDGVGFWGVKDRCMPVEPKEGGLPDWLLRAKKHSDLAKNVGTTLSILGFPGDKNWQRILAATIAENFFGAINREMLEVIIQDDTFINKDIIQSIFEDGETRAAIEHMKGQPDHFDDVRLYLKALAKSDDVIVEHTENLHLGNCELRILLGDGLPKRVAVLRNGMLITEDLEGLRKFGDYKDFVAVLECHSTKGNELLRAMEPPRHDDFDADRLPREGDRKKARVALKELSKWVKDMLKRHAQNPVSEVTCIDELAEFFADEGENGPDDRSGEKNPAGNVIIRARPLPPREKERDYETQTGAEQGGEMDGGLGGGGDEDGNVGNGGGRGDGDEGAGGGPSTKQDGADAGDTNGTARPPVRLGDVRAVPLTPTKRKIAFTPDYSGTATVTLEDSGADANYTLNVVVASIGDVTGGKLAAVKLTAGKRCVFEVELDRNFSGAIKVHANAV